MMPTLRFLIFLLALGASLLAMGHASADEQQANSRQRAQAHTDLGAAYFGQGQLGVALDELNTAVSADSGYAPAYGMLGLVYMALREDGKADESFRRSLSLNNADPDVHNNYGWFLCQTGKIDDAISHFMIALKNPLYATPEKPYLNAGICSRKKGNDADAEEFLLKSIRLQPRQPQALFNLADIYFKRANDSEAKKYITQFFRIAAPTLEGLWLGIRIEHRLGNRSDEASYVLQLRKLFPDSPEAQALRSGKYE
ncbi:MAG TPA: type IV pilus biogenesis/stability protein PilW [Sulfuricella sp.]|nr:type IV pilus biogenesis/stability protein PilW [Sulfuricella sp.]